MFTGFVKMAKVTITWAVDKQNVHLFYVKTKNLKDCRPFRHFQNVYFLLMLTLEKPVLPNCAYF